MINDRFIRGMLAGIIAGFRRFWPTGGLFSPLLIKQIVLGAGGIWNARGVTRFIASLPAMELLPGDDFAVAGAKT